MSTFVKHWPSKALCHIDPVLAVNLRGMQTYRPITLCDPLFL